ncbi:hypothetical protein OEZ86_007141 [Tetradesmus obliquus]|nr:hypothetical protein OEZ86_007141 [Tetradesmus obliquus]
MTRLVREADSQRDSRLLREFAASGMSVGCANTFLNPVGPAAAAAAAAGGVAPAEAALAAAASAISSSSSSSSSTAVAKRPGFVATASAIYKQEGASAFTRGIQASATRAVCNGGIRLGMYGPIKSLMSRDGSGQDLHVGQKLAAGSISGGMGAVLTTPIELAKTRLQAPSATTRSMSAVLKGVIAQQGVAGLWSGATPSVLRLILLNSSMVATYDEVKGRIMRATGWGSSSVQLVLASSMVAGLVTTTVINPADVIRAYMQTGRGSSLTGIAQAIYAKEGARGFLKGWSAAYARTGPQTLIIFSVSEVMRPVFGLAAIGGSA